VTVVVDVDLAVQVRVAAVGVHHQRVGAGDGLPGEDGGIGGGDRLDLLCGRDADAGEASARRIGLRGDDSISAPSAPLRPDWISPVTPL